MRRLSRQVADNMLVSLVASTAASTIARAVRCAGDTSKSSNDSDFFGAVNDPSNQRYVNKAAKEHLVIPDDERWLEAEIDENINTPQERYAHAHEMELIKKMMREMRQEHSEKLKSAKTERDNQVSELRKQMSQLESKIKSLNKEDE